MLHFERKGKIPKCCLVWNIILLSSWSVLWWQGGCNDRGFVIFPLGCCSFITACVLSWWNANIYYELECIVTQWLIIFLFQMRSGVPGLDMRVKIPVRSRGFGFRGRRNNPGVPFTLDGPSAEKASTRSRSVPGRMLLKTKDISRPVRYWRIHLIMSAYNTVGIWIADIQ